MMKRNAAKHARIARCPSCGSSNYRSQQTVWQPGSRERGPTNAAQPGAHVVGDCLSCGYRVNEFQAAGN
jgi:hypothetical protein